METVDLVLRLALAGVFSVSALGKLADRSGTRTAVESFGAPGPLARPIAVLLPLAELAIVALLLVPETAGAGAILALALLAAFSVAIGLNLARGRRPECHCFGQVHSEPISALTLVRNAGIASLAVAALALGSGAGELSAVGWLGDLEAAEVLLLGLAVTVAAALVLGSRFALTLLRQHGRLLVHIDRLEAALRDAGIEVPAEAEEPEPAPAAGLPVGAAAPDFELPAVGAGVIGLADLIDQERPLMLVFGDPACGPCEALAPEVARWQREHDDELRIALLYAGEAEAVAATASEHGLERVLIDTDRAVSERFEAHATPAALVVSPAGAIATPVSGGAPAIEALVARALGRGGPSIFQPTPGSTIPSLELRELDGGQVSLADRLATDRETAIVFWNPGCGFCRSIQPEVRRLTEDPDRSGPAIVVLSTGDQDAVRAEGFAAPILLDPNFEAASRLGANGTPIALLVGPERTIASNLAVGSEEVLELLAGRPEPNLDVVRSG